MKPDPGKTGWLVERILALKGMPVLVIDQIGRRYEGCLQLEGEYLISGFEVVKDTPSGKQSVIAVGPFARVLDVTGATIKVDLSRTIDVLVQGPGVLEEQSFFESSVSHVKLNEAKAQDSEAAEKQAAEDTSDDDDDTREHENAYERTHYLEPREVIRSVSLTSEGIVVWVDRLPAKKRRSS